MMEEFITEYWWVLVLVIFLVFVADKIVNLVKNILIIIEKLYLFIKKLLVATKNMILFIFKVIFGNIWKFLKWIFTSYHRYKYRQYLLSTPYNVMPEAFKVPLWRRFFSRKIRRENYERFRCIEKCIETQQFFDEDHDFIKLIEAATGKGKTSFETAYVHYKTISIINDIDQKMTNTEKILYRVNWKKVRRIIEYTYNNVNKSINYILDEVLSDKKIEKHFKGKFYNNYRQETPHVSLLKDYVIAYCAKLRNNYVMSNFKIYNHINGEYNLILPDNFLDIKTVTGVENFNIPYHCIIVEDELALTKLKNTNSVYDIEKTGRDTGMRLFRQMLAETSYYTGSSQNTSRTAKIFKELLNSDFEILSLEVVGAQKTYSRIFQKKEEELDRKLAKEKNPEKILLIKKQRFEAYQMQNKIYAAGYLKYTIRIAHSELEMSRYDKSDLQVIVIYVPMTWSWGAYSKYEFRDFYDYLIEKSKKTDGDQKVVQSMMERGDRKKFDDMIKPAEDKEAEKTTKEASKKAKKAKEEVKS